MPTENNKRRLQPDTKQPSDFFKKVQVHFLPSQCTDPRTKQQFANELFIKRLFRKASMDDEQITTAMRAWCGELIMLDLFSITLEQYQIFLKYLEINDCLIYGDTSEHSTKSEGERIIRMSVAIPLSSAYRLIKLADPIRHPPFFSPKNPELTVYEDEDLSDSAMGLILPCSLV